MDVNSIITLSLLLEQEKFQEVLERSYCGDDDISEDEEKYIDCSLEDQGLVIAYRNSTYKKKIKIIINSAVLMKNGEYEASKLVQKLEKYLSKYFDGQYHLEDFSVSGAVFITDIHTDNRDKTRAYMKIFKRIGRVKKFSPAACEKFGEGCYWKGNSNGIDFMIYSLQEAIQSRDKKKNCKTVIGNLEGILRAEVHLTKSKTIRACTNREPADEQIQELLENRNDILLSVLSRIIPYGDFYKKDAAQDIIRSQIQDLPLRRRMLRLVTLIPEKKSIFLAQKAMSYRKPDVLMEEFLKINLAPITISKRQDVKYLENFYSCLLK